MPSELKGNARKELLLQLGRKLYDGVEGEKIALIPNAGGQNFRTELERVITLIRYVKKKRKELQSGAKGTGK